MAAKADVAQVTVAAKAEVPLAIPTNGLIDLGDVDEESKNDPIQDKIELLEKQIAEEEN